MVSTELQKYLLVSLFFYFCCILVSDICLIINISYHNVSSTTKKVISYQFTWIACIIYLSRTA